MLILRWGWREGAEEDWGRGGRKRFEGGAGPGSHLAFRAADNKNALLPRNWIDRGWRGPAGGTRRAQRRGQQPGLCSDQGPAALPPAPPSLPPALSLSCSHRLVLIIFFLIYFSPSFSCSCYFFSFNFFLKLTALPMPQARGGGGAGAGICQARPLPTGLPGLLALSRAPLCLHIPQCNQLPPGSALVGAYLPLLLKKHPRSTPL